MFAAFAVGLSICDLATELGRVFAVQTLSAGERYLSENGFGVKGRSDGSYGD